MNKYQKSLNRFGLNYGFSALDGDTTDETDKSFDEDCRNFQELVDKATPRKVSKNVFGSWACDACGVSFQEWGQHTYCEHCGQKASWSGTL